MKSIVKTLILTFLVLNSVSFAQKQQSKQIERELLIDVGGCRLNFKVIKGGKKTILFESGGGGDSTQWKSIAERVAEKIKATIVTYDRAGFGKSDLPNVPCDMVEETRWLLNGLKKLGLCQNLILVGHSYGGLRIKLFGHLYPDKVIGMVFVDPFSAEIIELLGVDYLDNHAMTSAKKLPFYNNKPETLTKRQRAMLRMVAGGLGPELELMRDTRVPEGIPACLLTAGKAFWPKPEEQTAWRKSHQLIVSRNRGVKLIIAEQSGHNIGSSQPDLLIKTIEDVFSVAKEK